MGERALLLLGLLGLLTAANEVRHADAQHRATSDPSEGHAVKTGEREARALLVLDGKVNGAISLVASRITRLEVSAFLVTFTAFASSSV